MEYEMEYESLPRQGQNKDPEATEDQSPPRSRGAEIRKPSSLLGKNSVFSFKMPKFAWQGEQSTESENPDDEAEPSQAQDQDDDAQSRKPKPILKSRTQDEDSNETDKEAESYEFDPSLSNNSHEKKWNAFGWLRSRSKGAAEPQVHEVNDAIAVVSLRHLEKRIYQLRFIIMIMSLLGLGAGISVQEYCWLGYIPTPEEESGYCSNAIYVNRTGCTLAGSIWSQGIANPLDTEEKLCETGTAQSLKSLCTLFTVALLLTIFYMYQCLGRGICMRNHLEYRGPVVNLPFWNLGLLKEFCLEVVICLVHPMPLLSFTFAIQAEGRVSVYRIESVLVSLMFLRLYTVWRYFREWLFARFTSKHVASRMSDIAMDSQLAIKAILDDIPFETIAFVFVFSTVVLAYLVRIAEAPVNVQQLYFWNQLWLVVVTSTGVGYGDIYPQTNLGRFLCFIAMVVGACLTAVLIVAVSSKLAFNAGESRLLQFLQSEKWEKDIKIAATRCIQFWWRLSIHHPRTLQALRAFRDKKKAYRKFLEATPHFGVFVQQMKEDQGRVAETLSKIESKVSPKPPEDSPAKGPGGRGGGAAGPPVTAQVFDDLMQQMLQLQKTNEQLMQIVAQSRGAAGAAAPLLAGMQGGRRASVSGAAGGARRPSVTGASAAVAALAAGALGSPGAPAGRSGEEAVLIASAAVEERVKRMEAQIVNLDKGMAKCLGQVVRLIQGLY